MPYFVKRLLSFTLTVAFLFTSVDVSPAQYIAAKDTDSCLAATSRFNPITEAADLKDDAVFIGLSQLITKALYLNLPDTDLTDLKLSITSSEPLAALIDPKIYDYANMSRGVDGAIFLPCKDKLLRYFKPDMSAPPPSGAVMVSLDNNKPAAAEVVNRRRSADLNDGEPLLSHMALALPITDIGAEINSGEIVVSRNGLQKAAKLIPGFAKDGFGKIYPYGELYPISGTSVQTHQVPTSGQHFIHCGNATVMVNNYNTKQKRIGDLLLKDSFGNWFSIEGMDRWNPQLSDGDVDKDMRGLIDVIHRFRMKAIANFIPWLSPSVINERNYRWTFYHEISDERNFESRALPEERKETWLESLAAQDGSYCAVRINEGGIERVILVKLLEFFGSNSSDQVILNSFHNEVREYYRNALKRIIDAGFDEVRVDLPGLILKSNIGNFIPSFKNTAGIDWRSQEDIWGDLIRYAKGYAGETGRTFHFDMEAYDGREQEALFSLGADTAYDNGLFQAFWHIAREGGSARTLDNPVKKAFWTKSRSLIFPSNFDQMSLKAMGGPWKTFMMLTIVLSYLGANSMIDLRDYLGHTGNVIPVAGGNNEDKDSHPFLAEDELADRRDFTALSRAVRHSKFKGLVKEFYKTVDTRGEDRFDILDNSDRDRYFSLGWRTEKGNWQIFIFDTRPAQAKESVWVKLPYSGSLTGVDPEHFEAIYGRDRSIKLTMTKVDNNSHTIVTVPFASGEEYTSIRLNPRPPKEEFDAAQSRRITKLTSAVKWSFAKKDVDERRTVIIAVETKGIAHPDYETKIASFMIALKHLTETLKTDGIIDDVEIVIGNSKENLASSIADARKKLGTPLSNIAILASEETLASADLKDMRDNKAFLAYVDKEVLNKIPTDKMADIMLPEIIAAFARRIGAGINVRAINEQFGDRLTMEIDKDKSEMLGALVYRIIPKAEALDVGAFERMYSIQTKALETQA